MTGKNFVILLLLFLLTGVAYSLADPVEIIRELDRQRFLTSSSFKMKMIITYGPGDTREKTLEGYEQGEDMFFLHFLSPARDQGTRYLKRGKSMWLYLPKVDKVIHIKGHMLRQGMMGSDFSYEDTAENSHLLDKYTPVLLGEEKLEGEEVYVLELTAKNPGVTYYRRKVWVSKTSFMPLKSELYAKSGKLLKIGTAEDIRKIGADRYYPYRLTMKNVLKKDTLTVIEISDLKIDREIDPQIFELRHLKRR